MTEHYRADQVGSFLRPNDLKAAHQGHAEGHMPLEDLRKLEDAAIMEVLELQKLAHIDVYSDGEFRRAGWSGDFAEAVEGFAPGPPAVTVFNTARGNAPNQRPGRPSARVITQ